MYNSVAFLHVSIINGCGCGNCVSYPSIGNIGMNTVNYVFYSDSLESVTQNMRLLEEHMHR